MSIVKYTINKNQKPIKEQLKEIEKASKMPIVYDEDAPKLTDEQYAEIEKRLIRFSDDFLKTRPEDSLPQERPDLES